jgi:hypothetical protein
MSETLQEAKETPTKYLSNPLQGAAATTKLHRGNPKFLRD